MHVTERPGGTIRTFDGQPIQVRPIESGDWQALQRFHRTLSEETVEQRMFESMPELSDERAHHYSCIDGYNRFAIVAIDPDQPTEIIGVARFDREDEGDVAEYAAVVADRWQGHGIGLALTMRLISAALDRDINLLRAYVRAENWRMLTLLRNLGLPQTSVHDRGEVQVDLDIGSKRGRCNEQAFR